MLSYRHSFHAGNHGDVLKHWALVTMLDYLNKKDKPYLYLDTHSGAGAYQFQNVYGTKLQEHTQGVDKVLSAADLPESLQRFCEVIRAFDEKGRGQVYPGSPMIAKLLTRPVDRLRCYELHPADSKKLLKVMSGDQRVKVEVSDGLKAVKALLPPKEKRGLILIDPSYEVKSEYHQAIKAVKEGLKRFQTGVFAVWYPMLNHVENISFQEKLKKFDDAKWLSLKLVVDSTPGKKGMYGSGIFVVNPPWVLVNEAKQALPALAKILGQEGRGSFEITDSGNL